MAAESMANYALDAGDVSTRLLDWYARHGRELPWRKTRDPYRIWLSEIMLQQTTVTAVIPYYERFLRAFPSLSSLAAAPLDEVIQLWAGLGYYSRARNLHRAAVLLASEFSGEFPAELDRLMSLPGIGRSTAGAIRAIAFDLPAPILDGNVRRVLVRLYALNEDPRSSKAERQLWLWAEQLTSAERPHDYAQAIMDLGATLCRPREPQCGACPLRAHCLACRQGSAGRLPVKRGRKSVPLRQQAALLIRWQNRLQVSQRPPTGLLGGLWEFPVADLPADLPAERAGQVVVRAFGLPYQPERIGRIRHVYSHFKLELEVFALELRAVHQVAESDQRWQHINGLSETPLHGAHLKALALYHESHWAADGKSR